MLCPWRAVTPAVSSEVPLAGRAPRHSATAQASGHFAFEHDLHELANSIASIQRETLAYQHGVRGIREDRMCTPRTT